MLLINKNKDRTPTRRRSEMRGERMLSLYTSVVRLRVSSTKTWVLNDVKCADGTRGWAWEKELCDGVIVKYENAIPARRGKWNMTPLLVLTGINGVMLRTAMQERKKQLRQDKWNAMGFLPWALYHFRVAFTPNFINSFVSTFCFWRSSPEQVLCCCFLTFLGR